jgi:hypothetical protein
MHMMCLRKPQNRELKPPKESWMMFLIEQEEADWLMEN